MAEVTLPIRVMQRLGIEILVLTNAAGGVNPGFSAGDVMLITDHIGMVTMTGLNPLRGPNLDQFGVRFRMSVRCMTESYRL
jgi:purine-nucleoside phosphorylase